MPWKPSQNLASVADLENSPVLTPKTNGWGVEDVVEDTVVGLGNRASGANLVSTRPTAVVNDRLLYDSKN